MNSGSPAIEDDEPREHELAVLQPVSVSRSTLAVPVQEPAAPARARTPVPRPRRAGARASRPDRAGRSARRGRPGPCRGSATSSMSGRRPPAVAVADDPALVDQVPDDLLEEERVPLGPLAGSASWTDAGEVVDREQEADQPIGLLRGERIERDRRDVAPPAAPAGPALGQLGSGGAEEHHRPDDPVGELLEQVEQRGIGPVDVLDDGDHGFARGERREATIATRRGS